MVLSIPNKVFSRDHTAILRNIMEQCTGRQASFTLILLTLDQHCGEQHVPRFQWPSHLQGRQQEYGKVVSSLLWFSCLPLTGSCREQLKINAQESSGPHSPNSRNYTSDLAVASENYTHACGRRQMVDRLRDSSEWLGLEINTGQTKTSQALHWNHYWRVGRDHFTASTDRRNIRMGMWK